MRGRKSNKAIILVVEDEYIVALALAEALNAAGAFKVEICASAVDAMAFLNTAVPSAVVLDVALADRQDGWALAELVMLIGSPPPPIYFTTGNPQAVPPAIASLGTMVAKPYDTAWLAGAIRDRVRSSTVLGSLRKAAGLF